MKKRGLSLPILVSVLLLSFYFVFGTLEGDLGTATVTSEFTPGDGYAISNYTKGGQNATLNLTITVPALTGDNNITVVSIESPVNILLNDMGNLSNDSGAVLHTADFSVVSGGWDCDTSNVQDGIYLNWTCVNGSDSLLGSNTQFRFAFNFSANSTGTEEAIEWNITLVAINESNTVLFHTNLDAQAPVISLDNPSDFYNETATGSVVFNYTANDSNLDTCELWGNWSGWHLNETFINQSFGLTSGETNGSSNVTIEDGQYVWSVYCNDSLNNYNSTVDNRTLTVDLTAPNITLDSPVDFFNETATGSVTFNYTASDIVSDVDTCELWGNWTTGGWHLNETFVSPPEDATNGSSNITLENGTYVWTVYCNDSLANNNVTNANYTLTVDTGPTVVAVTPLAAHTYGSANINFQCTVTSYVGASNMSIFIYAPGGAQLYQTWAYDLGGVLGANTTTMVVNLTDNFTSLDQDTQFIWDCSATDVLNQQMFGQAGNITATVSLWGFYGNVTNSTYDLVEGANVTLYEYVSGNPPTEAVIDSVLTGSNGSYDFWNINGTIEMFKLKVKINGSDGNWTEVGAILPPLPKNAILTGIANGTLYTQPAATLRLNAYDADSWSDEFNYLILDVNIGKEIEMKISGENATAGTEVILPRERNITVIYLRDPNNFGDHAVPPLSYTLMNLSEHSSTNYVIELNRSLAYDDCSFEGYINVSGNETYANCTSIVTRVVPGVGGFVPPNTRIALNYYYGGGDSDDGIYFNQSLMCASDGINYVIEWFCNGTNEYFGAIRQIQMNATSSFGNNITATKLAGYWNDTSDSYTTNSGVNTTVICFNFTDASDPGRIVNDMMVDLEVKHDTFGTLHYMINTGATGTFNWTFLNDSTAYIRVYSKEFSPVRKQIDLTTDYCDNNNNISLQKFRMETADASGNIGAFSNNNLKLKFMRSNSVCNVPTPANDSTCVIGDPLDPNGFNPMQAMMAGKSNLMIDLGEGGASLYFINVDMLASGPPDAVLSENATTDSLTGSSFDQLWKFGSLAPDIYDYVLIGLPYNSSVDETWTFTAKIPALYDHDWNIIWNTTENGTSSSDISANYSDYSDYPSAWFTGYTCSTTDSTFSSTNCFMNTTENKFWLKIPHFSGTGPGMSGSAAATTTATSAGGSTSVGEGGYAPVDVSEGIVRTMSIKDALVISLGDLGGGSAGSNVPHQVVLNKLTSDSVTLLVYSEPIEVILKVGESKKVDVDGDGILDILIKLNSIDVPHQKADIYFEDITPKKEVAPSAEEVKEEEEVVEEKPAVPTGEAVAPEEAPSKAWIWVLVILVVVALVAVYFVAKKKGYNIINFKE